MTDLHFTITPAFADDLREFLVRKHLTQEQFCKRYKVGKSTFWRLLNGNTDRLALKTLMKLEKVMSDAKWPRAEPAPIEKPSPDLNVVKEKVSEVDFKTFVSDAGYVPRDLLLYVDSYPRAMPQIERSCIKALIETRVVAFHGLKSGFSVIYDEIAQKYRKRPPQQSPCIEIKEQYAKPVYRFLEMFFNTYVEPRDQYDIKHDGLNILAVEPDPTGKHVLDAWLLKGVVFGNSGIARAHRDLRLPLVEAPSYTIPLFADVSQADYILARAQKLFEKPSEL